MFGQLTKEQQREQVDLVHWLDQQLNEALLRRYIDEAKAGNYKAIFALKQLQARISVAKKTN